MNGLSGMPSYTPDTQREKLEKGVVTAWPKIYRFINGLFYLLFRTIKDGIIRAIQQIFKF